MKKRFVLFFCVMTCFFLMACSGQKNAEDKAAAEETQQALQLGANYLEELEYESAIAQFNMVLEIDPKNADAYLGIIEGYLRQGEYDTALDYAERGYSTTEDPRLLEKIEMIESGQIRDSKGRDLKITHSYEWESYATRYIYDKESRIATVVLLDEDGNETERQDCIYMMRRNGSTGKSQVHMSMRVFINTASISRHTAGWMSILCLRFQALTVNSDT